MRNAHHYCRPASWLARSSRPAASRRRKCRSRSARCCRQLSNPPSARHVAAGIVEPRFKSDLGFRVVGRLISRPVNVGDFVAEGQTLATLDATALEFAVRSARAELSKAQAQLAYASAAEERKRRLIGSDATTKAVAGHRRAGPCRRRSHGRSCTGEPDEGHRAAWLRAAEGRLCRCRHRGGRRCRASGLARAKGGDRRSARYSERPLWMSGRISRCRWRSACHLASSLQLLPGVSAEGQIREIAPQADPVDTDASGAHFPE